MVRRSGARPSMKRPAPQRADQRAIARAVAESMPSRPRDAKRPCRVPRRTWIEARRICASPLAAAQALSRLPAWLRPSLMHAARGRVVVETVGPLGVRRRTAYRREWSSTRARRTMACAWVLWRCGWGKDPSRGRRTTGIGRALLARLCGCSMSAVAASVHDVRGEMRSAPGRLGGRLGDACAGNGGYLRALEQAGCLRCWQPPVSVVPEGDRGERRPDGTQWATQHVRWCPANDPPR